MVLPIISAKTYPSMADLEKVSLDYAVLYQKEYPSHPERPVPTHVAPFQIKYGFPMEVEVEAEARQMRRNRAGGHTHLQAKRLQMWLREA